MASQVQICNLALGWLGTRSIASMSEATNEARVCTQYYEFALEQSLRDHRWNFAQRRRVLAETAFPEGYDATYAYCYAVPTDCLEAHTLVDESGSDKDLNGRAWVFEIVLTDDGAGKVILTQVGNATLTYTAKVTNPSLYDPLFVRAFAKRLAADMCVAILKNNPQKVQETETLYQNEIRRAKAVDAREGKEEEVQENPWVVARTLPEGR